MSGSLTLSTLKLVCKSICSIGLAKKRGHLSTNCVTSTSARPGTKTKSSTEFAQFVCGYAGSGVRVVLSCVLWAWWIGRARTCMQRKDRWSLG